MLKRLRRVRGQVDGLIKMYEEERGCTDIVTQISAARSALASVGKEILSSETVKCSKGQSDEELGSILKQLFDLS